ncbi:DinB family protein [Paenibacillus sp. Root444D2]|uniref:DinB family protein n=1 Tax=Paenibacillus sp. Root444D2 TaxID=1736538 RepID=UPI00070CCC9C|nr:DinB family protein [Paenibacillus sp. Root444D2]KQX60742.1 damage-inducible protein DinB [Paenibacillus sp. Root444D2]
MSTQILKNYEYHVWANKRVFTRLKELPEEILLQELSDVFPTIHAGLVHIYRVDTVWLSGMKGNSYDQIRELLVNVEEKTKGKSLKQLEAAFSELAEAYKTFLNSDVDWQAMKDFPHPTYGVLHASIEELIQHVVNHGTYHRGNITSMLRQLGHAGVSSDYVFYLYDVNK